MYPWEDKLVCMAYSSSWHDLGLIKVKRWSEEIGSTFDPDKAYDMMLEYYNRMKGEEK